METKAEKIAVLSNIILHKAQRIKKLKLECGQQATKICVLNERLEELEAQLKSARAIYDMYKECAEDKVKSQAERITELKIENGKLNIILYHRENGLSHADFKAEIEISKQAERIKELEDKLKDEYSRGVKDGLNQAACRYI